MLDFLKTAISSSTAEATTTPEIIMIETPKTSISQRIRDYKAANPDAKMKEIAQAVGTALPYVYQVLVSTKKKAKKAKPAAVSHVAAEPKPNLAAVPLKTHEETLKLLAGTIAENIDFKNEIIGLKAIIKYLENGHV